MITLSPILPNKAEAPDKRTSCLLVCGDSYEGVALLADESQQQEDCMETPFGFQAEPINQENQTSEQNNRV